MSYYEGVGNLIYDLGFTGWAENGDLLFGDFMGWWNTDNQELQIRFEVKYDDGLQCGWGYIITGINSKEQAINSFRKHCKQIEEHHYKSKKDDSWEDYWRPIKKQLVSLMIPITFFGA